jgi:hypothetical protein
LVRTRQIRQGRFDVAAYLLESLGIDVAVEIRQAGRAGGAILRLQIVTLVGCRGSQIEYGENGLKGYGLVNEGTLTGPGRDVYRASAKPVCELNQVKMTAPPCSLTGS